LIAYVLAFIGPRPYATGLAVKPVTLAPRLVTLIAPLVALGLGMSILAAGPGTTTDTTPIARPYSHIRRNVAMADEPQQLDRGDSRISR
jgi:hypothetical protein